MPRRSRLAPDAVGRAEPSPEEPSELVDLLRSEQGRGPKVIAFKRRRRKNSRRKRGHRQEFTLVRITEILTAGAKPSKAAAKPKAATKRARKPKAAEAAAEAAEKD